MSTITREDVLKLASLARLELTDEEIDKYQKELAGIFSYIEKLQSIDTDGIEPTYQVTGLVNVVRPDTVVDYHADPKSLLHNLPDRQNDLIKVKRMVG